jgi:hypothetical protein
MRELMTALKREIWRGYPNLQRAKISFLSHQNIIPLSYTILIAGLCQFPNESSAKVGREAE